MSRSDSEEVNLHIGNCAFTNTANTLQARNYLRLISLVSRDMPSFSAPTPSRGRPPPHLKISGPKSLGLDSFFREEHSMDQCRSRLKLSENFECHWSMLISGEIHMDQSLVHSFSWGNSHGPMVLKVLLKFPPTLALVHGWLFPAFSCLRVFLSSRGSPSAGHNPPRGSPGKFASQRALRGLSEGSAGVSPRVLRGSEGFWGGLRDFPRFLGGSDPMLVTLPNCWRVEGKQLSQPQIVCTLSFA